MITARSGALRVAAVLALGVLACKSSSNQTSPAGITVAISPQSATIAPLASQLFTATVSGASDPSVTWAVREGAGGGTITAGLYTAPSSTGTYHVVVTSVADTGKSAVAAVTVSTVPPPPSACTYGAGFALVQGRDVSTQVASAKPAKGTYFADPHYGSCVVRATDHTAEGGYSFLRNDYSRRQAFNADKTRFLAYSNDGSWLLYDTASLAQLKNLTLLGGDAEPQWHPTDPDLLYWVPINGGTVLNELNVSTGANRVVGDFAGRLPWSGVAHVWTKSEGSPSADGRFWCFMAESSGFGELGFFSWDLQTDTILATYSTTARPDHLSTSPSGNYCVPSWDAGVGPSGTWVFNRDWTNGYRLQNRSEHSDLAIGADGDDYYVAADFGGGTNEGWVFMTNLRTHVRTDLVPLYFSGGLVTDVHISGKAFNKPGWVLIGMYADNATGAVPWPYRKLTIVEMAANPRVYEVAHHHVQPYSGNYWDEPHASASRDFTKIAFNSNWNSGTTDVDDYLIFLPVGAFP